MKIRSIVKPLLFVGLLPGAAWAQSIGIGTTTPNASAMLDIVSTNKGVLVPRITQLARTSMNTPATGLLVYQTNGAQPGFWYYAGAGGWTFMNPAATATGDNLGNHTATQNLNLTNQLLVGGTAATPGTTGLRVDAAGNVGIGITAPAAKLDIAAPGTNQGLNLALNNAANTSTALNVNNLGSGYGVFSTARGHGVWGVTQTISGAGVIGDNATGEAVVGRSQGGAGVGAVVGRNDAGGYGVRGFNTSSGIGVLGQANASSTAVAGRFENTNVTNVSDVVQVSSNGNGQGLNLTLTKTSNNSTGISVVHSGTGPGIQSTSAGDHGVWGITQTISGAGVIGDNATGEAVVGRSQGGAGVGAVVGRNDAAGYGVRGFNTSSGIGVLGQANASSTAVAGRFENTSAANVSDVVQVASNGSGQGINLTLTKTSNNSTGISVVHSGTGPGIQSTSAGDHGVWGITQTISGAGVIGDNATGEAVVGRSQGGAGVGAVVGRSDGAGYGVRGFNTSSGIGVLGQANASSTAVSGRFENTNATNVSDVMQVASNGSGQGLNLTLTKASNGSTGISVAHAGTGPGVQSTSAGNHGVWGITQTISGAGVIGDNATGEAVVGRSQGGAGVGAVVGRNDAGGYGVRGFNTSSGIGVLGQANASSTAVAGRFENTSATNVSDVVQVSSNGSGRGISLALTKTSNGSTGINVAHAGTGAGIQSTSAGSHGVWGITQTIGGAGVIGDNATGEAVVGRSQGGAGVGAVVGRNDAAGYGVRGFNTSSGIGVLGQAGIAGGTGVAGKFENTSTTNASDAVVAATNGTGWAGNFTSTNATSGSRGVRIETTAGLGGTALNIANGTLVLAPQTGYTSGSVVDNPVLVVNAVSTIVIPTGAPLLNGATVWVVNNSNGIVTVSNTTAGNYNVASKRATQFLYVSAVGGTWVPVQ